MLIALSVSSGVEKVGAYAGLASIVGLAVMSLLYFAQAREVKRLRDWAGRAPERAAELEEQAMTRRVTPAPAAPAAAAVPEPVRAGSTSVRRLPSKPASAPATPAAGPPLAPAMTAAPALASATRMVGAPTAAAPPPVPVPAPVAPAPAAAPPTPPAPEPEPATSARPADPAVPAALTAAATRVVTPKPAASKPTTPKPAAPAPRSNGAGTPPTPPPAAPAARRAAPAPRPQASASSRPAAPRRGSSLTVAGIVVALLVIAGGAFAAVQLLSGSNDSTKGAPSSAAKAAGRTKRAKPGAAFSRKGITITVLNGTPVSGLASRVAAQLVAKGFKQGAVTNASDQARSATIVSFLPGHRADAVRVSRALPGAAVEPIDPTTRGIACPNATCASTVVVTVGSDRAQ